MELLVPLVVVALLVVGAKFLYEAHLKRQHEERCRFCWNQYQWALQNMHVDPRARANVVNLGRQYYGALRGTVTVYDEMAISNDIKQAGG